MESKLLFLLLLIVGSISGETTSQENEAKQYLQKYGYLSSNHSGDQEMKKAIETFQAFFGLRASGKLDKCTMAEIRKPRCGHPDVGTNSQFVGKWPENRNLTYFVQNGMDLDEDTVKGIINTVKGIIKEAWAVWSRYTGLEFEEVQEAKDADFKISFGTYTHHGTDAEHTCPHDFHGFDGEIAHAFAPRDGRIHFDDSEFWTDGISWAGFNLLEVAAHEFGHALGLGHSKVKTSVMWPLYQRLISVQPRPDDIAQIHSRYAKRPSIQYYMGGELQSCDEVCAKHNKVCAETGHSFPQNALSVFKSVGVSCITGKGNDLYRFNDNPAFMATGNWGGQCIGFKNIPNVINCGQALNPEVRRLCPCK